MQLDFEIDKLTRSIENAKTGDSFPTVILPLSKPDLLLITAEHRWKFDWETEYGLADRDVYKLTIINNPTVIQGLVSLRMADGFVEMPLIEVAPFNYGKEKMYLGVAANLVAYVCKQSFEVGFDGYVSFIAKSQLIAHYEKTLGAVRIGAQRMVIQTLQAKFLVDKYFPNSLKTD